MNNTKPISMPGHTIDYLMKHLTGNEFLMAMFFWRWTVGVNSDAVNVSASDIAGLTGLTKANITKAINKLVDMDLILVNKRKGKTNSYFINLNAGNSNE